MYDIDILEIAREKGEEEGFEKGVEKGVEKGIKKGIEKGEEKGTLLTAREMLVSALTERFSIVPFRISEQITSIGNAQSVKTLFPHVFRCGNIEEFEDVLKQMA